MLFKYFLFELEFGKFKNKHIINSMLTRIILPALKCIRHCLVKDTRFLASKNGVFGFVGCFCCGNGGVVVIWGFLFS